MIKVFGCLCYALTHMANRNKFQPRARRGVFLGFQAGMKSYIILDIDNKEIFVSRDVLFDELQFPFLKENQLQPASFSRPIGPLYSPNRSTNEESIALQPNKAQSTNSSEDSSLGSAQDSTLSKATLVPLSSLLSSVSHDSTSLPPRSAPPHRSSRFTRPPQRLADYHSSFSLNSLNQSTTRCMYLVSSVLDYSNLSPPHHRFTMSLSIESEPSNFEEVDSIHCWQEAMKAEVEALELNKTWTLVDLPPNVKLIACRWVYKIKRHPDGSVECYKARLIVKGYAQTEGLNYFEMFSPAVKMTTIPIVLALASIIRWHVQQLDVNNAFLHGDLARIFT